ncbi:MAG: hypothetical protein QXM89_03680 [Candidatus Bathyarchaeia archaeon]
MMPTIGMREMTFSTKEIGSKRKINNVDSIPKINIKPVFKPSISEFFIRPPSIHRVIYAGSNGNAHGDRNDEKPPKKAKVAKARFKASLLHLV